MDWRRYNIFEGLSWFEIGIVVTLGTLAAMVGAFIIAFIAFMLPIADNLKISVLFILGLVCICAGHFVMGRMKRSGANRGSKPNIE